jgi:hypothetical protein
MPTDDTLEQALRSAPPMLPEWSTTQEFAAWLGIPPATAQQWRWLGTGPRYKRFGKHVRYRRRDIETWLDAGPGPEPIEERKAQKRRSRRPTQQST